MNSIIFILSFFLIICSIPSFAECPQRPTFANCLKPGCCTQYGNYSNNFVLTNDASTQISNSVASADIISQVNTERAKYGLSPLKVSSNLTQAAYIRAKELTSVFSHIRPNGTSWSTVSTYAKAENIARGYNTPDKAIAAWLTSDGHKRNILNSSYNTIGVCSYEHNGIMYWVQLFGTK